MRFGIRAEKPLTLALAELILCCRMTNLKVSKKGIIVALSSSLVFIVASGAIVTLFTAVTYARSCSKLTGFPGLLQRAGIVSVGPCVTKIGGTVCGGGLACTAPDSKAGTCKNVAAAGQPASCQCVDNTVSKGLR